MKEEQATQLEVGDVVYLTTIANKTVIKAVICHEHLQDRLRKDFTAVKIIEPFEKNCVRIETSRLFTSKEAAEVAARLKR